MKLLTKIIRIAFAVLVVLGTINVQAAVAEPSAVSSLTDLTAITSIGIKPQTPTKVVNSSTFVTQGQTLEFDLLDSYGNPVSAGNYSGIVTLSGPAVFDDYSQSAELKVKNGQAKVTLYVTTDLYPGDITITPHIGNLLNKPFTETLYIHGLSGNATQTVLGSEPTITTFSPEALKSVGNEPFLTYNLQAEDVNGIPTATNAPTSITATVMYDGKPSTEVIATPTLSSNGTYCVPLQLMDKSSSLQMPAGTYTVTITPGDTAKITFAPLTETFIITSK